MKICYEDWFINQKYTTPTTNKIHPTNKYCYFSWLLSMDRFSVMFKFLIKSYSLVIFTGKEYILRRYSSWDWHSMFHAREMCIHSKFATWVYPFMHNVENCQP